MKKVWKKYKVYHNISEKVHIPLIRKVDIIAKENNIAKRKFKKSVANMQETKGNLLNKKEQRKVISDILSAITTQIRVN